MAGGIIQRQNLFLFPQGSSYPQSEALNKLSAVFSLGCNSGNLRVVLEETLD